jgi:hypothetical protein
MRKLLTILNSMLKYNVPWHDYHPEPISSNP